MQKEKRLNFFERYLTVWVGICIVIGVVIGTTFLDVVKPISAMNVYGVNIPVAILVWLMIFPMMVQIDFSSIKDVSKNYGGLGLTLFINWVVKPFTMALFAYIFFNYLYSSYINPSLAKEYIAGAILLGAAPCTAMVFVWSYLTEGDANYTLVQISVNDLVLLVAFIPIVKFLLGITDIVFPYEVLFTSVVVFVVIPLSLGYATNKLLIAKFGLEWFKNQFLSKLRPLSIIALLLTLVVLFTFQGDSILQKPFDIFLIAIPLAIQTYFIFFVTWFIGKKLKLQHNVCAPAAMIGASNFFELSVAIAIAMFGLQSGAALATVVGVLIEVPIMLSLVFLANKWKW
jgi:ACR3 family arsenite transporter